MRRVGRRPGLVVLMAVIGAMALPDAAAAALEFKARWGAFGAIGSPVGSAPGEFDLPAGVANDDAGNIYVADRDNNRVQKFSPTGTHLQTFGAEGSSAGELFGPTDVAVDAHGYVYVADQGNQRIQKFSAAGAFLLMWGKDVDSGGASGFEVCATPATCQVGTTGTLGGEFGGTLNLDVSPSQNRVYVVDGDNNRLQLFNKLGGFLGAFGGDVDSPNGDTTAEYCTTAANCLKGDTGGAGGFFNSPRGIVYDHDGQRYVYVADTYNNRIQRIDVLYATPSFAATIGADVITGGPTGLEECTVASTCKAGLYSSSDGGFANPIDVAYNKPTETFFTLDWDGRIQRFGLPFAFEQSVASSEGSGDGQFDAPTAITTNDAGKLYVTDAENARVQRFTTAFQYELKWGGNGGIGLPVGTAPGEFNNPHGVAIDAGGDIFVVDSNNRRIQRFAPDGTFKLSFGSYGVRAGEFLEPWSIAIGPSGALYVGEANRGRIQKFTPTGALLDEFSGTGTTGGLHRGVSGIAVDSAENIYTIDPDMSRIQKFNAAGEFQWAAGKDVILGGGTGPEICTVAANCGGPGGYGISGQDGGEFNWPYSVAISNNQDAIVADHFNNRIQRFGPDGSFKEAVGRDVDAGGGTEMESCTVSLDCQAGTNSPADGSLGTPLAVATDGAGAVYVVGDNSHTVQKLVGTTIVDSVGGLGSGAGMLRSAWGLAVDPSGNSVVVGDTENHRVQKFGEPVPTAPTPAADTRAPKLTGVSFKAPKRFRDRLVVKFTCDELCTAKGSVTVKLGRKTLRAKKTRTASAATKTSITLKFSKSNAKKIVAALRRHKRLKASLTLRAVDGVGNTTTLKRSARLR